MTVPRVLWILYVIGCLTLLGMYYLHRNDVVFPSSKWRFFIIIFLWPIIVPIAITFMIMDGKDKE